MGGEGKRSKAVKKKDEEKEEKVEEKAEDERITRT